MELQNYTQVFSFIAGINNPVTNIISLGVEERPTMYDYCYDNRTRNISSFLFQYTLSGEGICEINGIPHKVGKNQAFFIEIPSDTKYYIPKSASEPWRFIYIFMERGSMAEYYRETVKKSGIIFEMDYNCPVMAFLRDACLRSQSGLITDFATSSTIAFEFMNKIYFYFNDNTFSYSNRVQRILWELNTNYGRLESIGEVAASFGISENHLIREFKSEVGITPMKYLTQVRLEHAKRRLLSTNLSISEIAAECGYSRANYFCKVFRDNTGITPLTYKNGKRVID